jgi:hypothetical protein
MMGPLNDEIIIQKTLHKSFLFIKFMPTREMDPREIGIFDKAKGSRRREEILMQKRTVFYV